MIGKVLRGRNAGGLIRYLFGAGRANDHTNPRVVAGWDDPAVLESPMTTDASAISAAWSTGSTCHWSGLTPDQCVWHCSLRADPDDPTLTDAHWADVAAGVMDRTGLARRGDDGGCRWVAVRNANDHVHLVVTLARQDGRRAALHNDYYRVGEACRAVEERYSLRVHRRAGSDGGPRAGRAEIERPPGSASRN